MTYKNFKELMNVRWGGVLEPLVMTQVLPNPSEATTIQKVFTDILWATSLLIDDMILLKPLFQRIIII